VLTPDYKTYVQAVGLMQKKGRPDIGRLSCKTCESLGFQFTLPCPLLSWIAPPHEPSGN